MLKNIYLTIGLFCCSIAAWSQVNYKIYDVAQRKEINWSELITTLKPANIVFWGEEHNDSIGHVLEYTALKDLHQQQPALALSMEMFETDVQNIADEYLKSLIRKDNFEKDARVWPNYATDYAPMVEYAKEQHLDFIAANAPKRYVSAVTKNGLGYLDSFPTSSKTYFAPLPIKIDTGAYLQKFESIMGFNHNAGPYHYFESQNLWDATMAWSIFKYYQAHPKQQILQINGGFHTEDKLGTYAQLEDLLKKNKLSPKLMNIACFADSSLETPNWNAWKSRGDFLIVTQAKK